MRRLLPVLLLALLFSGLSAAAQPPGRMLTTTLDRLAPGTAALPAAALHHWRFSLALTAATAALIVFADRPASAQITSPSLERASRAWSDRGLLIVEPAFLLTAASVHARCLFCRPVGRLVLATAAAEAYTTASVQALKFAAGRERPYAPGDGDGGFNESGSSFPSGHAGGAFTMAAVLAHEYPNAPWTDWTGYAIAGGVSAARFTAKQHFLSDLLVGGTLGLLTGRCALQCQP